ncbi:MAG: SWIM zinc finger family protein [Porphyromonadaceae bacterium]|nr:SWIM zinc finger family protein [Porphyromonadaceae bacterium]
MYTLDNFDQFIPPRILERGWDYYRAGAVDSLEQLDKKTWSAWVSGTDDYEVEISLAGRKVLTADCDCPYDDTCKHIVAVLYEIKEHLNVVAPVVGLEIVDPPTAQQKGQLSHLTREELLSLVRDYSQIDRHFTQYLKRRLCPTERLIGLSDDQYQAIVRKIFEEQAGRGCDSYDFDWSAIFRHLYILRRQIDSLFQQEQWRAVLILAFETLRQIGCRWEGCLLYDDDVFDSLDEHLSWAYPKILEVCDRISQSNDAERLRTWALAYVNGIYYETQLIRNIHGDYADEDWLFEVRRLLSSEEEAIQAVRLSIEQETDPYRQTSHIQHLAKLYKQRGDIKSLDQLYHQYIHIADIRFALVQELIDRRLYQEAIKLCKESSKYSEDPTARYWQTRFLELELGCWERCSNARECIRVCRELFSSSREALKYYKKLRKLLPQADWEALRPKLMKSKRLSYEDLVWIYKDEKSYDQLFDIIDRYSHTGLNYLSDGRYLPAQYDARQLASLSNKVRTLASGQVDRKGYQLVAKLLSYMARLSGGREVVASILSEFRIKYRRRPAMLDELKRVKV